MSLFNANLLIRELRKARGLTQEQLAEGICSRSTIAMIEKGNRRPDRFIFFQTMYKLGVEPSHFSSELLSEEDVFFVNCHTELQRLVVSSNYKMLREKLDEIENDDRFKSGQGLEVFLGNSCAYYAHSNDKNPERALDYALRLLTLRRPDFDINKLDQYFLSAFEISMAGIIAAIYIELYGHEKAAEIRRMVIRNYEKNYTAKNYAIQNAYIVQLCGLANNLLEIKQYEECIEVASQAIEIATGNNYAARLYMESIRPKALALRHLNQTKEAEHLYKRYLMHIWAMGEHMDAQNTLFDEEKKTWETRFGYPLDLTLPW